VVVFRGECATACAAIAQDGGDDDGPAGAFTVRSPLHWSALPVHVVSGPPPHACLDDRMQ
jgi:hypothetical protein